MEPDETKLNLPDDAEAMARLLREYESYVPPAQFGMATARAGQSQKSTARPPRRKK